MTDKELNENWNFFCVFKLWIDVRDERGCCEIGKLFEFNFEIQNLKINVRLKKYLFFEYFFNFIANFYFLKIQF